ncbi:MAG: Hsp70 family protein [Candidatus Omnitrophota bacterium]
MANENIQIGIDLGTTNSEVVINSNGVIEVVKNAFGDEYTPSVFGFDKSKNGTVGKRAHERLYKNTSEEELRNNKAEVKRLMGTSETVYFERTGLKMNAEEISAEILKSLKEDVLRKYPDFDTLAAVITVPAYFSVLQSEATKRAGNLAGFKYVVLLQEPIAAAISYGFMNAKNENWLIYDLGGGTFDVALISSRDGVLSVLGHNGDNFLGGKDFDWLIVDRVIVPKILEKYSMSNFDRGNVKYRSVFAKLKYIAETLKIDLAQYGKTSIEIDGIGKDGLDKEICFSITFLRKEFEELIKPMVDRTIELAKKTLKEAGIKNTSVERTILVGGPTQIPYIRERLNNDLEITVDSSVDPLTVVAKGAGVFAISQKIPGEFFGGEPRKIKKGTQTLKLNYETLTSEPEPTISGIVDDFKNSEDEYYIQIQSESGFYSGSKTKLKNGTFFDTVVLEPNKTNLFWIYLFDQQGNSIPIDPDSFTITHGLSVSGAPISHSIGIAVVKKDIRGGFVPTEVFEEFFEKGSILPLKKTEPFKTVRRLKRNENDNPLWIKIGEGESDIPDRNVYVCTLGIKGSDLPYDLPEGTDIEITVEVNESRELFVTAYIPLIDLRLNARSTFKDEVVNVKDMESELAIEMDRARVIAKNCSTEKRNKIDNILQSVRTSLKNAHLDEDEKRKANKQLKDLKTYVDQLQKETEMPQLIEIFNAGIEQVQKIIDEFADQKEKNTNNEQLRKIKAEGEKAICENDKPLLSRINEQIEEFRMKTLLSNPEMWVYYFQQITQGDKKFINEKEANYYIEKGKRSIESGDVEDLKHCVRNLISLLPEEDQEIMKRNLAGITH